MPARRSAYCLNHSTETAVTKVFDELLQAADEGDVSALCLLDLTAAFDTVDYDLMLLKLERQFGLRGIVLKWFQSVTEYFKSFITVVRRILFTSRALCHKVRYSARGCSSCTLLISKRRLMSTASTITLLLTIRS